MHQITEKLVRRSAVAVLLLVLSSSSITYYNVADAFSTTLTHKKHITLNNIIMDQMSPSSLNMQKSSIPHEETRRQGKMLSASSIADFIVNEEEGWMASSIPESSVVESFILPVVSASLMITGNTVGAGMLVLPELMAGPGPMLSMGVLIGAWVMNLISGLAIAQVAIQQHESSGSDVPSSFKEFAEASLPSVASTVCGLSIAINTLILAFDVFKAGEIGSSLFPHVLDGQVISYMWGVSLARLVSTQSLGTLSQVASLLVVGLFSTFASLLLPGLANVSDPMSVLALSPTLPSEGVATGLLEMMPVVVTTLVFQNIVPTATRLLDYDRVKITTALTCGSVIPLLMYMAWSITMLGGGIDTSSSVAVGWMLSCFGLITVAGSSLGTSMSLSEEFEIMLGADKKDTFSLPSVALPIGISLLVGQLYASDITNLLKIAGSFGSPILYGAIPVAMALIQNSSQASKTSFSLSNRKAIGASVVPGGIAGLAMLAVGSTALVGTELLETFGSVAAI